MANVPRLGRGNRIDDTWVRPLERFRGKTQNEIGRYALNGKNDGQFRRFFVLRKSENFVKKVKTYKKGRKTLAKKAGKGYYIPIK